MEIMEHWRLFQDSPADGETNMAADFNLLREAENGATPALRIYGWSRPTLSIGYAQSADDDVDIEFAERNAIPVVRRPTGGRAVLHDAELTYAVAMPDSSAFHGSLSQVYEFVTDALRQAILSFGVKLDTSVSDAPLRSNPCCFATRTRSEISIGGRKVSGSAQRRLKRSALQHGSVILSIDTQKYLSCLKWKSEAAKHNAAMKMGGLNELGVDITREALSLAIVEAFEGLYNISFTYEGSAIIHAGGQVSTAGV